MAESTLEREVWVPRDIESVFEFFSDALNLEKLTPDWLHFRVVTPLPIQLGEGTLIDYRLRLRGIPLGWQSRITHWEPPTRFVDTQVRGPYRKWRHEHRFRATQGGTLVTDTIAYRVFGGRWIDGCLVAPDLRRIFDYRQQQLQIYLADPGRPGPS